MNLIQRRSWWMYRSKKLLVHLLATIAVVLCSSSCGKHELGASPPLSSSPRKMGFGINPSPSCSISDNGGAYASVGTSGVNVGAGDSISVQLSSYSGVRSWSLTVYGLDEITAAPTLSYSVGPPGTYSFTYPSAYGRAVLLKSVINGGADINGVSQPSFSTTIGVFSLTAGGQRVLAAGETFETNPVGWVADVNAIIRAGPGGAYPQAPPYTANVSLLAVSQTAWANTSGGPFTLTLPAPPVFGGIKVQTTDTGLSFSTSHWLAVSGGSLPILLPMNDPVSGALQGTLQSVFHETVAGESLSFAAVPNDPTLGNYWIAVGDGFSTGSAIGGVYTASTPSIFRTLGPSSQWVPANTSTGSFTITLPGTLFSLQVMTTDSGRSFSVSKPLVVCASGGASILMPTNDPVSGALQGTLQTCFHQTVQMSSYAWQLVIGDPTFVTPYWLAI